jgi:hypothetical protein
MLGSGRPSIILSTLKAAIVIGALSYVAADWLSNGFDRDGLARMAAQGEPEPLITGSIGDALRGGRLDPCGEEGR